MIVVDTGVLVAAVNRRDRFHASTFLSALATEGLTVTAPTSADFARMAELLRRYTDLPLDAVDAAVIVTAERLGTTKVATVDRRDFRVVVPTHCAAFDLLPVDLQPR